MLHLTLRCRSKVRLVKQVAKVNPIEVQKHLKGIDYPVSREDLVKHAEKNGADKTLRSLLSELPKDNFETPADVNQAIGQIE